MRSSKPTTRNIKPGKKPSSLRAHLALTTALATIAFGYAGRTAYAGICTTGGGGVFTCSGGIDPGSDVTQTMSGSPISVTTAAGFGIDTYISGGNALRLTGTGGATFTDNNASTIIADSRGIQAYNSTSGNLEITSTGSVTSGGVGTFDAGIFARNNSGTADLTISAASVTSANRGIYGRNEGTGDMSITATGSVSGGGTTGVGIFAVNYANNVTINANDVDGPQNAISISNQGTGAAAVTATGTVAGTTGTGIQISNSSTGPATSVTVSANNVSGGTDGISINNLGSGNNSVTVTGIVTGGASAGNYGIDANGLSGTDTTINLNSGAAVSAASGNAIRNDEGTSTVTVNSGASVTGAIKLGAGTDALTFDGGDFSGVTSFDGGTGTDSLTFKGVTGTVAGANVTGMESVTVDTASDVTFTGNLSTGQLTATNTGSGEMKVTSTGTVTGTTGNGISALNSLGTTSLTVSAGAVTGATSGIRTYNNTSGATTITTTGTVTGQTFVGIRAINLGAGNTNLTLSAATVSGVTDAIDVENRGTGFIDVTTTGAVTSTGTFGDGIQAFLNNTSGTNLSVTSAAVTGQTVGIDARSLGTGDINIDASGTVRGIDQEGIFANNVNGGDVTISVVSVAGAFSGIRALRGGAGAGALSVTATGNVTSGSRDGINAYNNSTGTTLTISADDVSGAQNGIFAQNDGSGTNSVTVSGTVAGGSGVFAGINTVTGSGGTTSITLNSGAGVSATSGTAILNDAGNSATLVNTGASVTGAITLGAGTDSLTFNGGTFTGVTSFDGGTGTDSLTFSNVTGSVAGGNVVGMENVTANYGASMAFTGTLSATSLTASGGAAITGAIAMDGGNNSVTFDNGDFSGVTSFNGGAGTDSLTFRNLTGALAGGTVSGIENVTIGSGGTVSVSGTLDTDTVTVIGTLGGTGILNADVSVQAGGTLSAGNSPGLLSIVGNLDLGVSSTTLIELAGTTAETEYDVIDVANDPATDPTIEGIATLAAGAILDIDFFGGFDAALGDVFDVLIADTINGDINSLSFDFTNALLAAGLEWEVSIVALSGGLNDGRDALRLTVILPEPASLPLFAAGLLGLLGWRRRPNRRPDWWRRG
jgi:hypothetical protein